jgi:hypothetical protein
MQKTNLTFDLFKLHVSEEDRNPTNSWIRAKGNLSNIVHKLLLDVQKIKKLSQIQFSSELATQIGCKKDTVFNYFSSANNNREIYYPLIFLETLIEKWSEICNIEPTKIRNQINTNIWSLTIGNRTSKEIIAMRELSPIFCGIIGAHAADGTLSKNYQIILIDGHEEAVRIFSTLINRCFGLNSKIEKSKYSNAYLCRFNNKIIGRYFTQFFGFPIGEKTYTVTEPNIIQKSPLVFRKAFAKGVMTFDGSVRLDGRIGIQIRSKNLFNQLKKIFELDKIKIYTSNTRDGFFSIESQPSSKWLHYFEEGSIKYLRLKYNLFGFETRTNDKAIAFRRFEQFFPNSKNFIPVSDFIKKCASLKIVTSKTVIPITAISKMNLVRAYISTLRSANILIEIGKFKINEGILYSLTKIVPENQIIFRLDDRIIKEIWKKLKQNQVSIKDQTQVDSSVYTRWRNLSRGIPFNCLRKILNAANIETKTVLEHISDIKGFKGLTIYVYNPNIKEWLIP